MTKHARYEKHVFIAGAAALHRAYHYASVAESFRWATHLWQKDRRTDPAMWSPLFKRAVENRHKYLLR
jgi:hypothetical protein